MFEKPEARDESEEMTRTLEKVLLDAIEGLVYESHEEHVDYEEMGYQEAGRQQSSDSSGGRSAFSMLLLGVAFAAIGYAIGKRSRSGGGMGSDTSIGIQDATDKVADRTQEMAESTADKVRESGQQLSERTEATAGEASERIEESTEEVGDKIEESGSEASDKMEDSG